MLYFQKKIVKFLFNYCVSQTFCTLKNLLNQLLIYRKDPAKILFFNNIYQNDVKKNSINWKNCLMEFVILKHFENLVNENSRDKINQILPKDISTEEFFSGNETLRQVLIHPSDLFEKLLEKAEKVIIESHVYEEFDLDYVSRYK